VLELFNPETVGNTSTFTTDPCANAVVNGKAQNGAGATLAQCKNTGVTAAQFGNILDCPANQCGLATGGNSALRPETSDTTELGFVFTPSFVRNFTVSVDWFNINVMGAVGTLPAGDVLADCLDEDQFCNLVKRNSAGELFGPQSVAGGGYVAAINANVGALQTKGMDFESSYRVHLQDLGLQNLGSVDFLFQGTWTESYVDNPGPGFASFNCAGLFGPTCANTPSNGIVPAWKHKLRATWNTPWQVQASLQWRYISGVDNEAISNQAAFQGETAPPSQQHIGAVSYFDLTANWKVKDGLVLRAGVNNIFDRDPPLISAASFVGAGAPNTYPIYDLEGRTIFMGLTANW
jgi:outer membrane receptor protein involved in Fe transport